MLDNMTPYIICYVILYARICYIKWYNILYYILLCVILLTYYIISYDSICLIVLHYIIYYIIYNMICYIKLYADWLIEYDNRNILESLIKVTQIIIRYNMYR